MATEATIKPWFRPAATSYLLYNASVVDVELGKLSHNMTVSVENGKITSITPAKKALEPKPGFTAVDCSGKYICPGLIDSHVHLIAVPGFDNLAAAFGNPDSVSLLRQPYAVREEIRTGSDFIKIMGSGGVSSPTDKITHLQFTPEEIRTMVECANNAGTYVTAHAYTSKAIRHCIDNGVKGIEHGNFLDAETAAIMVEKGCYLTPTLITYDQMASPKWKGYLPPSETAKNLEVLGAGLKALKTASDAGVTICFGTDLLGPLGAAQTHEFNLRSQVLSSLEVLRSATLNPARMFGRADSLGQIKEGFEADLLILGANPLDDVTILDKPEQYVKAVMKEGRVYKSRWVGIAEDSLAVRLRPAAL
ncbi:hypothetical protein E8E13_011418 [Curvularia kusanoi]|uniref:Amidohydrolase-related domain-containing protein n=1 Tax=Curvularia kusanoi TaxID=90978 RepID=A0A9P4WEV2_CURKU|nr:hypothetical protein E8E13_011418 [Curvularia kusanoi]